MWNGIRWNEIYEFHSANYFNKSDTHANHLMTTNSINNQNKFTNLRLMAKCAETGQRDRKLAKTKSHDTFHSHFICRFSLNGNAIVIFSRICFCSFDA